MFDTLYLLSVLAATSGAVLLLARWRGMKMSLLPRAVRHTIGCVGASLVFWALNVAVGSAVALLVRALGLGFVSLYLNADVSVLLLSSLQALVFETWRAQHRCEALPSAPRSTS